MSHGRKYGEKDSHPIPLWNGILDHCQRIGPALWEFIWLLDKVTEDRDGLGIVLGGVPVKAEQIANDLREHLNSARAHLSTLERECYIVRTRTPYGQVIRVRNSRKFGIWKTSERVTKTCESHGRESQKPVTQTHKNLVPESQKTVDVIKTQQYAAIDAAVGTACPVWKETGVNPARLPGPFRKLCEDLWPTRNGQSLGQFMGVCLDGWDALGGGKYPAVFVRAKTEIAAKEREQAGSLPELEAEPWRK